MNEVKNIPRLRFSEFEDKWTSCIVDDIFDVNDGTHQTPKYVSEGIPFVSVESIKDLYSTKKFITEDAFEKEYKIKPKKDDILMTRITAGIIGDTAIVMDDNPLAYYVSLALLRKKTDSDVNFHEQRINTSIFKKELHKRIIHVAFPKKINLGDIKKCSFSFPSLNEQQKIADFLTSIDKRIELLDKKKTLLETYKKGVMKKIFNQEIRFKDDNGSDFPDWEEKRLGEISNITIGKFVIKTKQNPESEYPVYNGGKSWTGFYDEYNNEGNKIVISARGANAGYVNFEKKRFWAGNSCYSIDMIDHTKHKIEYFFFYIKCFENRFTDYQQAANIPSVSKKDVTVFKVSFPSYKEQDKIHRFLENIDTQIKLLGTQINKSKTWKKGLLQKMFV